MRIGHSAACATLLLGLTACLSTDNVKTVDIASDNGADDMHAIKCAVQQAGWTITYADTEFLSGTQASGSSAGPLSLNIRINPADGTQRPVSFTIHPPARNFFIGDMVKPVVNALPACGAHATAVVATSAPPPPGDASR